MYVSQLSKYDRERYSPLQAEEALYVYRSCPYDVALLLQKRSEENVVCGWSKCVKLMNKEIAPPYLALQFMNVELSMDRGRSAIR